MSKGFTKNVLGLVPVADAFAGTKATDVVEVGGHRLVSFKILKGAGATGTSTITVEACDDFVPTTTEAITFRYQAVTSGDTEGALTEATTAGFTTTAGANQIYIVYVDWNDIVSTGYSKIRLKAVEVVDSAVAGAVLIELDGARTNEETQDTVIA